MILDCGVGSLFFSALGGGFGLSKAENGETKSNIDFLGGVGFASTGLLKGLEVGEVTGGGTSPPNGDAVPDAAGSEGRESWEGEELEWLITGSASVVGLPVRQLR